MIKNDSLYFLYEIYIANKKVSNGNKSMMKISEYYFNDFKSKYETSLTFKNKIDNLSKKEIRDDKINNILNENYR